MSWARIAIYYALAAVLTFYLAGIARERSAAVEKPATAKTAPFLEAVPERIDRVRMEKDGLAIVFERRAGRWVFTEPEGLAPPGDVVDAVLESFTSLPAIEIMQGGAEHDGQFGLIPPRARIRIEQEGALVSTIILGELSPTRTAVYAKKSGQDDVALIGLNAKYYIDLVFENVRRQRGSEGAATAAGDAGIAGDAAAPADAATKTDAPAAAPAPPAAAAPNAPNAPNAREAR